MIHIIGTAYSRTQFWSDAIRHHVSIDTCASIVERFESYLRNTTLSLNAQVIAEENSRYRVDQMEGGSSVAQQVAEDVGTDHVYCDPDPEERRSLNITSPEDRELI